VIVRINDRGPFKQNRLIDLSYAAAYKLRITAQGSAPVEVEWIDTSPEALRKMNTAPVAASTSTVGTMPVAFKETSPETIAAATAANNVESRPTSYYVQVGAFKNELNGDLLQKKILGLDLAGDAAVTNVYNDGIYRVKLGPFATRKEADVSANKVRKQLNLSSIVTNQ
jgi:rare lipoprotein A